LSAIALTAVLTHLMFRAGLMISTSELYLAGLISLLSSTIFRFLTAEKRGSFFQNAISVFVGKKFAATISEEQHISLSGSRQLVTILFSDIRGFTAFCEEKDPALVVDLLNEYMGGMVKIIVSYHGNVNKFIGDGILAIFSDEDGTVHGDHPLRAVRCGTEMCQLPGRFKTGVGIHTGLAVVGNVGSQDKMEYTVLGDTVNLASRLESLNKEMKTQLILSEATRELLNGQFETAYLGDVPIRGKTVPLVVHTAAVLRAPRQESGTLAEKS
jgi:adenylate cyclase